MKTSYVTSAVELFVGGCTGSAVCPAERIVRMEESASITSRPLHRSMYGTHTTSLAIVMGTTGIIIDNGSGIMRTTEYLRARGVTSLYILQTHYHADHMSGMVMNPFFFDRSGIVKGVFGPKFAGVDMRLAMDHVFVPHAWPVSPAMFGITHPVASFIPNDIVPVMGGIQTLLLNHAGGSVGYRIPTPVGDIVIATNCELSTDEAQMAMAQFISGAHIAYFDVQYRDDEYFGVRVIGSGGTRVLRKNWGHSTPTMLVKVFERIVEAPKTTLIGHHDPKRSDDDLITFEKEVQAIISHLGTAVTFAQEGHLLSFNRTVPPRIKEFAVV